MNVNVFLRHILKVCYIKIWRAMAHSNIDIVRFPIQLTSGKHSWQLGNMTNIEVTSVTSNTFLRKSLFPSEMIEWCGGKPFGKISPTENPNWSQFLIELIWNKDCATGTPGNLLITMMMMTMMMVMATMLTRLMVTELMWNKIRATGTAPNQDQTKEEPSRTTERNSWCPVFNLQKTLGAPVGALQRHVSGIFDGDKIRIHLRH